MKVEYDRVGSDLRYPLSAAEVRECVRRCVPEEIADQIRRVRFGCNRRTTQEARIVAKGNIYEIRINFLPRDGRTKVLSKEATWASAVREVGGVIDSEKGEVSWPADSARRYTAFLLFHEIAHILYAKRSQRGEISTFKSSAAEESWCDRFAIESARALFQRP